LSDINKPRSFKIGAFEAVLDCDCWHNRWLEKALKYLPEDLFKNIKEKILFTSTANRDACRLARRYCESYEIILISERLLPGENIKRDDEAKARYSIYAVLHEVAHVIRKHKSPRFDDLSNAETQEQEGEADKLALTWFNDHIIKFDLPPITKEEIKAAQDVQQAAMKKLRDGI
jgi:hypothetical protein